MPGNIHYHVRKFPILDRCAVVCYDCNKTFYTKDMPHGDEIPLNCPFCGADISGITIEPAAKRAQAMTNRRHKRRGK